MNKIIEINGERVDINLPGDPKASLYGPSYLEWDDGIVIDSACQKENLVTGKASKDIAILLDQIVKYFCHHEDAGGSVRHRDGKSLVEIGRGMNWRVVKRDDIALIAYLLGQEWYPAVFPRLPDSVLDSIMSAEGNELEPVSENTSTGSATETSTKTPKSLTKTASTRSRTSSKATATSPSAVTTGSTA